MVLLIYLNKKEGIHIKFTKLLSILICLSVFFSAFSVFAAAATPDEQVLTSVKGIQTTGLTKSPSEKQADKIMKNLSTVSGYNATYTSIFTDAYFCGDSIIYPLGYYNYVSPYNTSGQVGARLDFLESKMPTIIASQPEYVIFHFGMNCLSTSSYLNNTFIPTYKKLINQLQAAVPGVTVFISCLFPTTAEGLATVPNGQMRPSYNAALRKMCADNGWHFISSEELVNKMIYSMSSDGLHLYGTFYNGYWLKYIMMETGLMGLSMLGDVDCNGLVQAADARSVLRNSVNLTTFTMQQERTADADGDSTISAADARIILRLSVGLDSTRTRETELLANLNAQRAKNGMPALRYDAKLSNLASGRALDMQRTGSTTHNTALYGLPFDAMTSRGIPYTTAAECIVASSTTNWSYENGSSASFAEYEKVGIGISPNTNTCVLLFTD